MTVTATSVPMAISGPRSPQSMTPQPKPASTPHRSSTRQKSADTDSSGSGWKGSDRMGDRTGSSW